MRQARPAAEGDRRCGKESVTVPGSTLGSSDELLLDYGGAPNEGQGGLRLGTRFYCAAIYTVGQDANLLTAEHDALLKLEAAFGGPGTFQRFAVAGGVEWVVPKATLPVPANPNP